MGTKKGTGMYAAGPLFLFFSTLTSVIYFCHVVIFYHFWLKFHLIVYLKNNYVSFERWTWNAEGIFYLLLFFLLHLEWIYFYVN